MKLKEIAERLDIPKHVLKELKDGHLGTDDNWDVQQYAEEHYHGQHASDKAFAENYADDLGLIDGNPQWPYDNIDWDGAAVDLMHDYFEIDGYYFYSA